MKVYISTFYQWDNYGSRLQNFALCQAIQTLGGEPVTLGLKKNEKSINLLKKIAKEILTFLPIICHKQWLWRFSRIRRLAFQDFSQKLCLRLIDQDECYNLDFFDAVSLAGGDQVWLSSLLLKYPQEREFYFLRFAPMKKRFAYSPSFGEEQIPNALLGIYKTYLSEFQGLSIREISGQAAIRNLTGLEVPLMPDPVFLLGNTIWRDVAGETEEEIPEGKYALTYFLGEHDGELWKKLEGYAKNHGLDILRVAGNDYTGREIVPSPQMFLKLIDGAQIVFTDSFHASAFSIILGRPFIVFQRPDLKQFSRLETLLQKYKMNMAFVEREELPVDYDTISHQENFDEASKIMSTEQEKGLNYLRQILASTSDILRKQERISMSNQPKVSVLVAIYNIEKYVGKCIQSILDQDYKNLEIILVDDCSTDLSGKICDAFAAQDRRILVAHHATNMRLSCVRNTGLARASGKYIVFVDGDDWLAPDFVSYMLHVITETDAEMAINLVRFSTRDIQQVERRPIEVWSPEKATAELIFPHITIGCWNKIYRRDFIEKHHLRFRPELFTAEGERFISDAAQRCSRVGVGYRKVYYYRQNNPNSAVTKYDIRQGTGACDACKGIERDLIIRTPLTLSAIRHQIWLNHFWLVRQIVGTHSEKENHRLLYNACRYLRRQAFWGIKAASSFRQRIKYCLIALSPIMMAKITNYRFERALKADIEQGNVTGEKDV